MAQTVFEKSAGLSDKTGIFSFCPAETFNLLDKCPVILSKENNILTTNIPSVLQILICPAKDYSLSDSCPASVEKISRRLPSRPNGIMSSVVSLPNHTFTGQA